jgi:hypothetical protein
MANTNDVIAKINQVSRNAINFKIGKTGQELESRPDAEYRKGYSFIIRITWSRDKEKIDELEKEMIKYFKNRANCDNRQDGGGAMTEARGVYILYVVFNKRAKTRKR